MTGDPVELELKYRAADPSAARAVLDAPLAGFAPEGPAVEVRFADRYLDTADGACLRAGWAVRLREGGPAPRLALKSLARAGSGPLHERAELEGDADPATAPAAWPASAARDRLLALAGSAPLETLVVLRQVRRRQVVTRGGARVELSADAVEVVRDGAVLDRFAELEAELLDGPARALEALGEALAGREDLVAAGPSKLERALEALRAAGALPAWVPDALEAATQGTAAPAEPPPALVPPRTPGVTAGDPLAEAGRKVLHFHLARMLAREAGARDGVDAELKAMRVAIRRQRAAWRVFGDAFDPRATADLRRPLRDLGRVLGAVRDLDVLLQGLAADRARAPEGDAAGLDRLAAAWTARRDEARTALLAWLDAPAHAAWVERYLTFTRTAGAGAIPAAPPLPHRVRDTMGSRIWAAFEAVRAFEPVVATADAVVLHDLRLAGKWLRYTVEFARDALPRDAATAIEAVVALQDHLGALNDAHVGAALARDTLLENATEVTEAEGRAIARWVAAREHEAEALRAGFGPAWAGVADPAFGRLLARVVAEL